MTDPNATTPPGPPPGFATWTDFRLAVLGEEEARSHRRADDVRRLEEFRTGGRPAREHDGLTRLRGDGDGLARLRGWAR